MFGLSTQYVQPTQPTRKKITMERKSNPKYENIEAFHELVGKRTKQIVDDPQSSHPSLSSDVCQLCKLVLMYGYVLHRRTNQPDLATFIRSSMKVDNCLHANADWTIDKLRAICFPQKSANLRELADDVLDHVLLFQHHMSNRTLQLLHKLKILNGQPSGSLFADVILFENKFCVFNQFAKTCMDIHNLMMEIGQRRAWKYWSVRQDLLRILFEYHQIRTSTTLIHVTDNLLKTQSVGDLQKTYSFDRKLDNWRWWDRDDFQQITLGKFQSDINDVMFSVKISHSKSRQWMIHTILNPYMIHDLGSIVYDYLFDYTLV